MFDIESEVIRLLEDNGFDPARPPSGKYLACCVVGCGRVKCVPGLRAKAKWNRLTDEILFRAGMPNEMEDFVLRHELGERKFSLAGIRPEHIEELCDSFAAALSCPAPAVRGALARHGRHLAALALDLGTTQSVAALRLGEVTGSPIALITPRSVLVRGEPFFQATGEAIREIARSRTVPASLQRSRLTDAPRRTVLRAA